MKHFLNSILARAGLCFVFLGCQRSEDVDAAGEAAMTPPDPVMVGATVRLVGDRAGIKDIAVDANNVYWAATVASGTDNEQRGEVGKTARLGGSPTVLASGRAARSVAVNAQTVFFTAGRYQEASVQWETFALERVPKAGGTVTRLYPTAALPLQEGLLWAGADIFADGTDVYYVGGAGLVRLPIANPMPRALTMAVVNRGIAMTETEVILVGCRGGGHSQGIVEVSKKTEAMSNGPGGCNYAADEAGGTIYWIGGGGGFTSLMAARLNGAPKALGAVPGVVSLPETDGTRVAVILPYAYISTTAGAIKRVAIDGSETTTFVASDVHPRARLVADNDSLYWVSTDETSIWRARVK